jgi:hypothetical protein
MPNRIKCTSWIVRSVACTTANITRNLHQSALHNLDASMACDDRWCRSCCWHQHGGEELARHTSSTRLKPAMMARKNEIRPSFANSSKVLARNNCGRLYRRNTYTATITIHCQRMCQRRHAQTGTTSMALDNWTSGTACFSLSPHYTNQCTLCIQHATA